MRWLVVLFSLWLNSAYAEEALALEEAPLFDPPSTQEVDSRTYALGKILRCPVCQGLSVADSQSDAAVAMKNRIQELVSLGYSDDQIVDYFIGRYGEFVLLQPKSKHWFVWFAPGVGLLLGVGVVAVRWKKFEQPNDELINEIVDLEDPYRAKILAELEELWIGKYGVRL